MEHRIIVKIIANRLEKLIQQHDGKESWGKMNKYDITKKLIEELDELTTELIKCDKPAMIAHEGMDVILSCVMLMDKLNEWTVDRGRRYMHDTLT